MGNGNIVSWILIGAIIIVMAVMVVVSGRRQKKAQEDYMGMLDTLRPGVKVKMVSGLLGRIKEIREELPGFKTVTLNIGEDKNVIEMTFVIEAVQGVVNEEAINKIKTENMLADADKATEVKSENANENVDAAKTAKTSSKKKTVNKNK